MESARVMRGDAPRGLDEIGKPAKDAKTEEFRAKLKAAREQGLRNGTTWRHYKGGTYKVLGLEIDTDDTSVRVRYHRIGGPGFHPFNNEDEIEFSRPLREWFENSGVVHQGEPVPRFVSVQKIERFETEAEIAERGRN